MTAPNFDQNLRLLQRIKDLALEKLIAQPGIEALDIAVRPMIAPLGRSLNGLTPGAAWGDVGGLGANSFDPALHCLGDELGAVVGPDMCRHAA